MNWLTLHCNVLIVFFENIILPVYNENIIENIILPVYNDGISQYSTHKLFLTRAILDFSCLSCIKSSHNKLNGPASSTMHSRLFYQNISSIDLSQNSTWFDLMDECKTSKVISYDTWWKSAWCFFRWVCMINRMMSDVNLQITLKQGQLNLSHQAENS